MQYIKTKNSGQFFELDSGAIRLLYSAFVKNKGITIIEVLVVIIISAILASIGIPVYIESIEKTKGQRAGSNIELIKDAYRIYYIKYGSSPDISGLSNIDANLSLELADTSFSYTIQNDTGGQYKEITASRANGRHSGNTLIYNLDPADGTPDAWDSVNSTWPWGP